MARIRSESTGNRRVGRRIECVTSTSSTNDEAWRRIDADGADGIVILAEHQSSGRGRLGRTWVSPRGASLLCSVGIVGAPVEVTAGGITGGEIGLLTAVAVCEAVADRTELIPTIKWPNDILVADRKLGGVLVEARGLQNGRPAYVVGIGINCLQQAGHFTGDLALTATSLEVESRQPIDRSALAISLLRTLDRWLAAPEAWEYADLRRAWSRWFHSIGRRVALRHADQIHSGTILDVDPHAALVVQLDEGGIRKFNAADTTVHDVNAS